MTREEIRTVTLSKARLGQGMTVWDIGSGTGSISVEAARMTPGGKVYAVEKTDEGCRLTGENCLRFGVENVQVVPGEAPMALENLPPPHRVIIGGSGGHIREIIMAAGKRMLPGGRMVVNAVTLETLTSSLDFLGNAWETEIVHVSVSKAKMMGESRLMKAFNPVYIISAWKCGV
ncbi:MAG: precorrin-6Y C5,15-methyltransferase (decarboxylating) subunit CbiT [Bacillota bacterium]